MKKTHLGQCWAGIDKACILLMVLIALTRIPFLANSPLEQGELWRECDTDSIAVNFAERDINIFYPQLNYDGEPPNHVQLEFQLFTFVTALFYKIFGRHFIIPRIIALLCFMLSACQLYLLVSRYDKTAAFASAAIYAAFPISIFFSRAIMPEALLMLLIIWAFHTFVIWYEDQEGDNRYLYMSAVLTCLAIAVKTVALFIGVGMFILCAKKYGFRMFRRKEVWGFAMLALVPYAAFFAFTTYSAEFPIVFLIGAKHVINAKALQIFSLDGLVAFYDTMRQAFGAAGIIIIAASYAVFPKLPFPLKCLVIALTLEGLIMVAIIKFPYYALPFCLAAAVLIGYGLKYTMPLREITICACIVFFLINQCYTLPWYDAGRYAWMRDAVRVLDENTDRDDLIVIGTFDPGILALGNRFGWRANISHYDFIPRGPEPETEYFREHGAEYFYVYNNEIYNDADRNYIQYLDTNFTKTDFGEGHVIYNLKQTVY